MRLFSIFHFNLVAWSLTPRLELVSQKYGVIKPSYHKPRSSIRHIYSSCENICVTLHLSIGSINAVMSSKSWIPFIHNRKTKDVLLKQVKWKKRDEEGVVEEEKSRSTKQKEKCNEKEIIPEIILERLILICSYVCMLQNTQFLIATVFARPFFTALAPMSMHDIGWRLRYPPIRLPTESWALLPRWV